MSWAKLDDGLHDHPKVDAMLDADELRGAAALGLWVAALSYAAGQLTDGEITRRVVGRLFPEHGSDLAAVLVEHHLWDETDTGWRISGYLDCNPPREDVLERRRADAERHAASRARRASERTSSRKSVQPSERTPAVSPNGRPDTPSRPVPSQQHPLTPASGGTTPQAAPSRPNGNRTRDLDAYRQLMAEWSSHHFPGADPRAVASTVEDAIGAGIDPTAENVTAYAEKRGSAFAATLEPVPNRRAAA